MSVDRAGARELRVLPHNRRDGFWASIRGHALDLADPSSGGALAPTPDDLLVVSVASELAWSVRRFLRDAGLPEDVSVSATWRPDPPGPVRIELTATVSRRAQATAAALAASLKSGIAVRPLTEPVVHISFEGADR